MVHPHISFFEEEGFTVLEDISKPLGFQVIKVSAGQYTVHFDDSRPFGYVNLNIESLEKGGPLVKGTPGPEAILIRIATRVSGCQSGIGFRCGWVPYPPPPTFADRRAFRAKVSVEHEQQLIIVFHQSVPWESLQRE
jgi:hypothetical protein